MRVKRVLRYYCDFCRRGYFKKDAILRHEKGCTANPDRVCGLCEYAVPSLKQKPISELIGTMKPVIDGSSTVDEGMTALRNLAEDCPGCILAAIRQSGVMNELYDSEYGFPDLKFDFKKELADWWAGKNEAGLSI